MSIRYKKPKLVNLCAALSTIAVCTVGSIPNQACEGGFLNVGPCNAGESAGEGCTPGASPSNYNTCSKGNNASACTNGRWAGII